jgi:hypothetical protein
LLLSLIIFALMINTMYLFSCNKQDHITQSVIIIIIVIIITSTVIV